MRYLASFVMICLIAPEFSSVAAAANKTHYVYVRVAAKRIASDSTSPGEPIRPTNGRTVRAGEEVEILITDPNPLILKYGTTVETVDTEDHKTALAFAQALAVLLKRFDTSAASGDTTVAIVDDLDLIQFRSDVVTLAARILEIGRWIDLSIKASSAADADRLKATIDGKAILDAIKRLRAAAPLASAIWTKCLEDKPLKDGDGNAVSCDAPFDRRAVVEKRRLQNVWFDLRTHELPRATSVAAALSSESERAARAAQEAAAAVLKLEGNGNGAQIDADILAQARLNRDAAAAAAEESRRRAEFAAGRVAAVQTSIDATYQRIAEMDSKIAAAEADAARGITIRAFMNAVVPAREELRADAAILESFVKDLDGLMKETSLGTWAHSLQVQKVSIHIAAHSKYDAFLSEQARAEQKARAASYVVEVSPHRAAFLRPGVGFVMGFVRNPTFSTKKDGERYRIIQDETPLTRFNVAAMLNIQPRSWSEPTFGGFFQVGVSPKTDETGFFVGGGISSESLFTFGGGFMYQQVRTLAPGLSLTETIGKPEDLKTTTAFKGGLYIHATVSLPK